MYRFYGSEITMLNEDIPIISHTLEFFFRLLSLEDYKKCINLKIVSLPGLISESTAHESFRGILCIFNLSV